MKPSKKKSDEKYRAALEKIASDLGCDLGIAVAPVILWERGSGISETEGRYVCLAAWALNTSPYVGRG